MGRVFTALDVDGQPTDEYVNGSLVNMTMVNASSVNGSTIFGLELFYVSTPGYRGAPVSTLTWAAWDGDMARSLNKKAVAVVVVKCPIGFSKRALPPPPKGGGNATAPAGRAWQIQIMLTTSSDVTSLQT